MFQAEEQNRMIEGQKQRSPLHRVQDCILDLQPPRGPIPAENWYGIKIIVLVEAELRQEKEVGDEADGGETCDDRQ